MVQLNRNRNQLVGLSAAVFLEGAHRDSVSIVSLVKSDIASITSSSPKRAHLSTIWDAMSCISLNGQMQILLDSRKEPKKNECLTRKHLLDGHWTECWHEDPVSRAPEPVIVVRSEYAFGHDIFQLRYCAGWELDEIPARTELTCQFIPYDEKLVLAPKAELVNGTYQ